MLEGAGRAAQPVTGERGEAALRMEPPPPPAIVPGTIVLFEGAYFDTGKSELKPDGVAAVAELAAALHAAPALRARIEGNTDAQGDSDYNESLSLRRAQAVHEQLIREGVARDRLTVLGLGERQPVADNGTAHGRARNRRVEVKILG